MDSLGLVMFHTSMREAAGHHDETSVGEVGALDDGLPVPVWARSSMLQRNACHCGCDGACSDEEEVQADGEVGAADSPLEAEADKVATDMVGAPPSDLASDGMGDESQDGELPTLISDASGAPVPPAGSDEPPQLQSSSSGRSGGAQLGHVMSAVNAERAGGAALAPSARNFFEPRFGVDFSAVRVHDDPGANELNRSLQARAFTSGSDIFFRAGHYQPDSDPGRSLLAHELTHVVQQAGTQRSPRSLADRIDRLTPHWAAPDAISASRDTLQRDPQKPAGVGGSGDMVALYAFVPKTYTDVNHAYRLFERTAYGKETNASWSCGGNPCNLANFLGKQVKFLVPRTSVAGLTDPAKIKGREDAKKQLGGLGAAKKKAITDEVDKRYEKATGNKADKPGGKAGSKDKQDDGKTLQWEQQLEGALADQKKLEDLPAKVKDLLTGKRPIEPKDYERLVQIAKKLATLSDQDLAAFKWLTVRGTDNLDLFEKAVDAFIARKAELVKAFQAQQGQPPPTTTPAKKDDLQAAFDEKWKDLDESALATMSESDRLDLAEKKANELTAAQLKYMKDHPGETLKDFAESAALLNTGETFKGIGKDLQEAATGDANTWARFAGGAGAGAKLSGWIMAVAAVLYVASWLTGIGELATIAAVAGYALAATITLSAVERELRVKAASQTKDPAEFKRQIQLAAAAQGNVIVSVALLVVAAALHFVAKTAFPKTVAKMRTSLLNLREKIRIKGSIYAIKPKVKAEMEAHRAEVDKACTDAKAQSAGMSKEVAAMDLEQFVDRLESGKGDFLDQSKAPADQRPNYRELTKTPEGRAAIEKYKQAVVDSLAKDTPATIEKIKTDYLGKIDEFLNDVDAAKNHEELGKAADKFDPALGDENLKKLMSGEQDKLTKQKLADAQAELEAKAQALKQPPATPANPPTTVSPKTEPPKTEPPSKPPASPADAATAVITTEIKAKVAEVEARLKPLRAKRGDLSAANQKARLADDKVKQLDAEIKRTTDPAKVKDLENQRTAALKERKLAGDELKALREKDDITNDSEVDYEIGALEKELAELNDALNPKPVGALDPKKPVGGAYKDLEAQGGERHHVPADSANEHLTSGEGPVVRLEIADHKATSSSGSGKRAVEIRAKQTKLINEGKFMEALEMDVNELRTKFGAKYEVGIQQMLDYVSKNAKIKALSKNSKVTVQSLRTPTAVTK